MKYQDKYPGSYNRVANIFTLEFEELSDELKQFLFEFNILSPDGIKYIINVPPYKKSKECAVEEADTSSNS